MSEAWGGRADLDAMRRRLSAPLVIRAVAYRYKYVYNHIISYILSHGGGPPASFHTARRQRAQSSVRLVLAARSERRGHYIIADLGSIISHGGGPAGA